MLSIPLNLSVSYEVRQPKVISKAPQIDVTFMDPRGVVASFSSLEASLPDAPLYKKITTDCVGTLSIRVNPSRAISNTLISVRNLEPGHLTLRSLVVFCEGDKSYSFAFRALEALNQDI